MDFKFQRQRLNTIPEEKILSELERVAKHFNYIEFGWRDFNKIADISANPIKKHFGSWRKGLEALKKQLQSKGLDLKPRPFAPNRIYSDKEMFDEMERIWKQVGQRPSRYEWDMSKPKISLNAYKKRFGGWTNACLRFIEYKMGHDVLIQDKSVPNQEVQIEETKEGSRHPQEKRYISLGVRLEVLKRDNFKCVFCGKSPATNIGTKLHIDHVIPFSKGGKSVLENLQTLCEECNLGKSDKKVCMEN